MRAAQDTVLRTIEDAERTLRAATAMRTAGIALMHQLADAEAAHADGVDDALEARPATVLGAQRSAIAEIATTLRVPEGTVTRWWNQARTATVEHPRLLGALARGEVSERHVSVALDELESLPLDRRDGLEAEILAKAPAVTASSLQAFARRRRELRHPESVATRHRKARAGRHLLVAPPRDGMSTLTAHLPSVAAAAIFNRSTDAARALQGPDDPRTLTQLRADAFMAYALSAEKILFAPGPDAVPTDLSRVPQTSSAQGTLAAREAMPTTVAPESEGPTPEDLEACTSSPAIAPPPASTRGGGKRRPGSHRASMSSPRKHRDRTDAARRSARKRRPPTRSSAPVHAAGSPGGAALRAPDAWDAASPDETVATGAPGQACQTVQTSPMDPLERSGPPEPWMSTEMRWLESALAESAGDDDAHVATSACDVDMYGIAPTVAVTVPASWLVSAVTHDDVSVDDSTAGNGAVSDGAVSLSTVSDGAVGPSTASDGIDGTAELVGVGPIDRDTALALVARAPSLRRILTDPHSGVALDLSRTTYRVPAELRTLLQLRDVTCRFPGCRRRAEACDVDHVESWEEGGTTSHENLVHLCRSHHRLKHMGTWELEVSAATDDGDRVGVRDTPGPRPSELVWRSPTGRTTSTYASLEGSTSGLGREPGAPHE